MSEQRDHAAGPGEPHEQPWVSAGRGNWLRFDPLTTTEVDAIVDRLDRDYGAADMAGRYAAAWLDVARLLSTLAAIPGEPLGGKK